MFATKILVASAIAASSLAFAAKPADAASHVQVAVGCAPAVTYYQPAPVVTYYQPAPTYYTTPTYVAPTYCPPPVVRYDRDDYIRIPDFFLRFGFGGHHDDHHREFHPDYHDSHHDRH